MSCGRIYMSVSAADLASFTRLGGPHPKHLARDLESAGLPVWFPEADDGRGGGEAVGREQMNWLALRSAVAVVVLISDAYLASDACRLEATQAASVLRKPVIPVILTKRDWVKLDHLGLLFAGLLYVDLHEDEAYAKNMPGLTERQHHLLRLSGMAAAPTGDQFDCLISYCWLNSCHAFNQGQVPSVKGEEFADPRRIKEALERLPAVDPPGGASGRRMRPWLDIENLGFSSAGLYEGIRNGLANSRGVIICASDAYARSANCQMECRFSMRGLRLPVVLALVGPPEVDTPDAPAPWRCTEVGMLTSEVDPGRVVDFRNVRDMAAFQAAVERTATALRAATAAANTAAITNSLTAAAPAPHTSHGGGEAAARLEALLDHMEGARRLAIQYLRWSVFNSSSSCPPGEPSSTPLPPALCGAVPFVGPCPSSLPPLPPALRWAIPRSGRR